MQGSKNVNNWDATPQETVLNIRIVLKAGI